MRKVKIGLIGCGTVGGGVVKLLFKEGSNYQDRFGPEIELSKVCSRTKSKITALGVPEERIVDDYRQIIDDPEIDIVVELVGGTGFAGDVVRDALKAGKNVVTANKALLAEFGEEIFHLADSGNGSVSFEAAVGGGIPIVDPLKRSLVGNRINSVMGILNGTTNYMLTRMAEEGLSYQEVLADAQRLGYAEADPTADVEGHDAAAKIALLSSMVFNSRVNVHDVYTNGISTISPVDFKRADHMGYVIKLLAIGRRTAEGIDVRVHPAMLPKTHPMASVNGVYNAVYITGEPIGDVMFFGQGAGEGATASAVMGNIIDAARCIAEGSPVGFACTCIYKLPYMPIEDLESRYYIRLEVKDQHGTLHAISEVFDDCGISIRTMSQSLLGDDSCELTFVTHTAREASVQQALNKLSQLSCLQSIGTLIRIEEN
ncbi:MAG: homoserine dehydrogenase [Coriobacteriales bacterium]